MARAAGDSASGPDPGTTAPCGSGRTGSTAQGKGPHRKETAGARPRRRDRRGGRKGRQGGQPQGGAGRPGETAEEAAQKGAMQKTGPWSGAEGWCRLGDAQDRGGASARDGRRAGRQARRRSGRWAGSRAGLARAQARQQTLKNATPRRESTSTVLFLFGVLTDLIHGAGLTRRLQRLLPHLACPWRCRTSAS